MLAADDPKRMFESASGDIMLSTQPVPETVAQLLVRQLDDDLKARLKRRAARHGLSMEEEARRILRQALEDEGAPRAGLGSRIAARFAKIGLDTPVPELRGQRVRPPDFGR
jgi:plasmid stability protein